MKNILRKTQGFTLIELLIVIALIGILAVALLSAINPLEQLRKGRDSARKADAAELLNAVERFYTSYQCYPWSFNGTDNTCNATPSQYNGGATAAVPDFTGASGNISVNALLSKNELKQEFYQRIRNTGNPSYNRLFMIENNYSTNVAGQVSVCFEPESATGRAAGLGRLNPPNNPAISGNCPTSYTGGLGLTASSNCAICLPQ